MTRTHSPTYELSAIKPRRSLKFVTITFYYVERFPCILIPETLIQHSSHYNPLYGLSVAFERAVISAAAQATKRARGLALVRVPADL